MSPNPIRSTLVAGAVIALAIAHSPASWAAEPAESTTDNSPIVIAQTTAPVSGARDAGATVDVYPAYQRGVRKAASEGPEALRRYVWRTRMIHNFYYHDFAPKN